MFHFLRFLDKVLLYVTAAKFLINCILHISLGQKVKKYSTTRVKVVLGYSYSKCKEMQAGQLLNRKQHISPVQQPPQYFLNSTEAVLTSARAPVHTWGSYRSQGLSANCQRICSQLQRTFRNKEKSFINTNKLKLQTIITPAHHFQKQPILLLCSRNGVLLRFSLK